MAGRIWRDPQAKNIGTVMVGGSFAPNGASAIDNTLNQGSGWSVARTGTGQYTITLQDSYVNVYAANASLQLSAPDDKSMQWGAIDVVNAKTLVLTVWDNSAAAPADVAANASNRVHFMIHMKNTTVNS